MTASISLPEKFTSNSDEELKRLATHPVDSDTHIDGTDVRALGAKAAESLVRLAQRCRKAGVSITFTMSSDMEEDLKIVGLYNVLTEKEAAQ